MTKHEIYEALKADGAKLPKAERFMALDDLKAIYTERFGVDSDNPAKKEATLDEDEAPNSHLLRDEDDHTAVNVKKNTIRLLRFIESGWCPALNRSYSRGLYRPKSFAEYMALKPYAEEVV